MSALATHPGVVRLPAAEDMVRTDHFCAECADHIYAGEPVTEVGTINDETAYAHLECLTALPELVMILPPNPDWRGWTDYEGWSAWRNASR